MDRYCAVLESGANVSITERPGLHFPVIVDLDLAYDVPGATPPDAASPSAPCSSACASTSAHASAPAEGDPDDGRREASAKVLTRVHGDAFVADVVRAYANEIYAMMPVGEDAVAIEAIVMQRRAPYVRAPGRVRDGLHIMFPNCVLSRPGQAVLRTRVIPAIAAALANLPGQIHDAEACVDACYCENNANWQMYGSRKPGREPYLATHVVRTMFVASRCVSLRAMSVERPRDWRAWVPRLSVRTCTPSDALAVSEDAAEEIDRLEESWARRHFDVLRTRGVLDSSDVDGSVHGATSETTKVGAPEIAKARELVRCFSDERAEEYTRWRNVGFALKNTSSELVDAWHEFSARSSKYDRRVCQLFWDRLDADTRPGPRLRFGSLVAWAKDDSPENFEEIDRSSRDGLLRAAIIGNSHTDWGRFVRDRMSKRLASVRASATSKERLLYVFDNHRWHFEPDGARIKNMLKDDTVREVEEFLERPENADDEVLVKSAPRAIANLKNKGFRDSVLGDIAESVADDGFQDRLDTRRDLIGWANGVFDLQAQIFRDGDPDDYVTMSTGHEYKPPDHPDYRETARDFDDFMAKMHVDAPLRKYCLDSLAVMLSGRISFEQMHCWTGTGSNGKSRTIKLLDEGLGDYLKTLPPSLLTGARPESGKATPELCSAAGARIIVLPEMDGKATINVAVMKELTGGDKIAVRALYGASTVIRPQFTIIMTCNDLSKVDSNDEGTWRRLKVLPYKSTFVLDADGRDLGPRTFAADNNLDTRFETWAPYVVSMLQARYPAALVDMRTEPEEIKAEVRQYRMASDRDSDFVKQNLVAVVPESGVAGHMGDEADAYDEADAWALLDIYKREGRDRGITLSKLVEKLERFGIPPPVVDDATGTATIPGYRLASRAGRT